MKQRRIIHSTCVIAGGTGQESNNSCRDIAGVGTAIFISNAQLESCRTAIAVTSQNDVLKSEIHTIQISNNCLNFCLIDCA